MAQAVFDHGIPPIDEGYQVIVFPDEDPLVSFFRVLQHKPQPGIVALVLDTTKTTATTAKAHAFCLSQADPVEGTIGATDQRLSEYRIQMLSEPTDPESFADFMQRVLRKAVPHSQMRESDRPFLFPCARKSTGSLPGRIGPHRSQSFQALGEHRVVELPPGFQMAAQAGGLTCAHQQGQFEQEGRRVFFRLLLSIFWVLVFLAHRRVCYRFPLSEHIFQY